MADQRDKETSGQEQSGQEKSGEKRVVGRGMTSPDSTEAVLYASTGEPDPRAREPRDASSAREDDDDDEESTDTSGR